MILCWLEEWDPAVDAMVTLMEGAHWCFKVCMRLCQGHVAWERKYLIQHLELKHKNKIGGAHQQW